MPSQRRVRARTAVVSALFALCFHPQSHASSAPSAHCHVTDGVFTVCPDGSSEWLDVPSQEFPKARSFLYADQADLVAPSGVDTFMLMYEQCGSMERLDAEDYVRIAFGTVDEDGGVEKLEHYVIHIFGDGTIIFVENGEIVPSDTGEIRAAEIEGQRGRVGFGRSANCPFDHVIAEFEIRLASADVSLNGEYSPDPLFWSSNLAPGRPRLLKQTSTRVPIQVDILDNANISQERLEGAINRAQEILRNQNVNVEMTIELTRSGLGVDGNIDSSLGWLANLFSHSDAELSNGQGLKISVANRLPDGDLGVAPTVGAGLFPHLMVTDDQSTETLGNTIAHEIGHLANNPHNATLIPGNLMNDLPSPGDLNLTTDQAALIQDYLNNHGTVVEEHSPGELVRQQFGFVSDPPADIPAGAPMYLDLVHSRLSAVETDQNVALEFALAGLFTSSGPIDATYRVLFDADNDLSSGVSILGLAGIDRELQVVASRGSDARVAFAASILDHITGFSTALPAEPEASEGSLSESAAPPLFTVLQAFLPRDLLGLAADQVPVAVKTIRQQGEVDSSELVLDQKAYERIPALQIRVESAVPAQPVEFTLGGLTPSAGFQLRIDGVQVLAATLDATGGYFGTFAFPTLPPGKYFLVARDTAGASAFNVIAAAPPRTLGVATDRTISGGYVAAGVGLRGQAQGAITISGVPEGAAIVSAILYWGALDNGESSALRAMRFNTVPIAGQLIGIGPDTCWGRTNSFAYRADVTTLVSGNGTYVLSNVPVSGSILMNGATLLVLYEQAGAPLTRVVVKDGNVVIAPGLLSGIVAFPAFSASSLPTATTTFIVGDGQTFVESASVTGSLGTLPLANPFSGSDGAYWDTRSLDVSSLIAPGSVDPSTSISVQFLPPPFDCLQWIGQVMAVTVQSADRDDDNTPDPLDNCVSEPNPGQEDSNLNGIGDACETPGVSHGTTSFLQAQLDGDTHQEAAPSGVTAEPTIEERLVRIVEFRVGAGLAQSPEDLASNLVSSQVALGLISPADAESVTQAVLQDACVNSTSVCDDMNVCTDDSCDSDSGCVHANNLLGCSDGNACTSADVCGSGSCQPGAAVDPNDNNPCTDDSCDPSTGIHNDPNTAPCSDGNACTTGDACGGGSCRPGGGQVDCNDGSPCTDDTCDAGPGCQHGFNTNACDDGDAGTMNDTCSNGVCAGGSACEPGAPPRVTGYYQSLCNGPHSGDELTSADAACVAALSTTFADVTSVADICAELHTTGFNKCEKAEESLMAMALNICKGRVCAGQSIDSGCSSYSTVSDSFVAADAALALDSRTMQTCNAADCQAREINNGRALELNSLTITHVAGEIRLAWEPPRLDDPQQLQGYKIWRRAVGSLAPFTHVGTTTTPHFVDPTGLTGNFEYDIQSF